MPAKMQGGPHDRRGTRPSDASGGSGRGRDLSTDRSKAGSPRRSHATLSVWAAALILFGVFVFGLRQVRGWLHGMEEALQQVAQDNKLLLEGLDEILTRTEKSDREADVRFPPPALSDGNEKSETDRSEPDNTARRYKIYYRTKDGEDLAGVGEKFNVSVDQLRLWNALKETDSLISGQVLVINKSTHPKKAGPAKTVEEGSPSLPPDAQRVAKGEEHVEEAPDSAEPVPGLALQTGAEQDEPAGEETKVDGSAPAEGISDTSGVKEEEPGTGAAEPVAEEPEVEKAETPLPAPTGETTYRVQNGDNLYRIGRVYEMSWKRIAAANGITDPSQIRVGQVLKIPTKESGVPQP